MATARTEMRDGKRTKPNPAGTLPLCGQGVAPREMWSVADAVRSLDSGLALSFSAGCRSRSACFLNNAEGTIGKGECMLQKGNLLRKERRFGRLWRVGRLPCAVLPALQLPSYYPPPSSRSYDRIGTLRLSWQKANPGPQPEHKRSTTTPLLVTLHYHRTTGGERASTGSSSMIYIRHDSPAIRLRTRATNLHQCRATGLPLAIRTNLIAYRRQPRPTVLA